MNPETKVTDRKSPMANIGQGGQSAIQSKVFIGCTSVPYINILAGYIQEQENGNQSVTD